MSFQFIMQKCGRVPGNFDVSLRKHYREYFYFDFFKCIFGLYLKILQQNPKSHFVIGESRLSTKGFCQKR